VANPENVDREFWGDIIKRNGGSGGPYYNGWICKFFPYIGPDKYKKNTFDRITDVPTGVSSVPITWIYYGAELKMKFTAGFYGYRFENNTFKPEISWIVHEDIVFTELEINILNTYKNGKYHLDADTCYWYDGNVFCDSCKRQFAPKNDPAIHYDKWDLCMKCVEQVRDTLAK
jgi:hypothetical protein